MVSLKLRFWSRHYKTRHLTGQSSQLWTWMLELWPKHITMSGPMDSVQVGKKVFAKESWTTLGFEPRAFSCFRIYWQICCQSTKNIVISAINGKPGKILANLNTTNHELFVRCYNLTGRDLIEKSFKLVTRLPLLLHRGAEGQLDQGAQGAVLHVGDEEVKNFLVRVLDCPV